MSGWIDKKRASQFVVSQKVKSVSDLVARQLSIDRNRMMSYERSHPIALRGRQCTMWLCRFGLELKWSEIRKAVHRHHSTVIHAVRRFGVIMTEDEQWRKFAQECLTAIESGGYLINKHGIATVIQQQVRPEARELLEKAKVTAKLPTAPVERFAETAFNERDGSTGTPRQKLEEQNAKFLDAMRKALQN